jgi:hypothetical protein
MNRRVPFLLALALACAGPIACGSDSPTNPTNPGTGTLTIVGQQDFLTIGTVITLQATRTTTTSATVAADWSSDDGRVAAINRQGQLTALASGTTTVRAAFEQQTASFVVRVAPNFAGTWEGRARVTACTSPAATFCQPLYAVGTQFVTRVTLVQSRDQVVGTLYTPYLATLPAIPPLVVDGTLSGRIELGGRLPMTGTLVGPTPTSPAAGTIDDWRSEIDPTQPILRGSYIEVNVATAGNTSISWEFIGLTRLPS